MLLQALSLGPASVNSFKNSSAAGPGPAYLTPSLAPTAALPLPSGGVLAQYQPPNPPLLDGVDWSIFFRTQLANACVAGVQLQAGIYQVPC